MLPQQKFSAITLFLSKDKNFQNDPCILNYGFIYTNNSSCNVLKESFFEDTYVHLSL